MNPKLQGFLQFARILDNNQQLSITNVAVLVVLVKVAVTTEFTVGLSLAVLFVLLGYAGKKLLAKFPEKQDPTQEQLRQIENELAQLRDKVGAVALRSGLAGIKK